MWKLIQLSVFMVLPVTDMIWNWTDWAGHNTTIPLHGWFSDGGIANVFR
jgi:hypothetical protein